MNLKVVRYLDVIFWVTGWATLALMMLTVFMEIRLYSLPPTEFDPLDRQLDIFKTALLVFSSIGQAFFALLLSVVFNMIFRGSVSHSRKAEKFSKIACIGFVGAGTFSVFNWVKTIASNFSNYSFTSEAEITFTFSQLIGVFSALMPFVYAAAIYTLYSYISRNSVRR